MFQFARKRTAPIFYWMIAFWIIAFAAIPIWANFDSAGWDVGIYYDAIHSVVRHNDPYADAIAIQDAFHNTVDHHRGPTPLFSYDRSPFSYIYPPITLPLLRFIGALPVTIAAALYWSLYGLCALGIVWAGIQAAEPRERLPFLFIAPAVFFFPGLLQNDTILSGNVVIIFYGFVLTAAILGWRKGRWGWFYIAILLASCFKPPLLTLLAIPLLSARGQLRTASFTAATSLLLFAGQALSSPVLFRHFLEAVNHQFAYIRDFGCSPAGLISNLLFGFGISDSFIDFLVYLAYAVPLFASLYYLSRQFLREHLTLEQWSPVLLVGVILLNPRIMQYDTFILALPMGFIAWRVLARIRSRTLAVAILCVVLAATSFCAVQSLESWWLTEGPLLVIVFSAGCWDLLCRLRENATVHSEADLRNVALQDRLAA